MGTNADHQRAWRQSQKLWVAQLEAAKPRKNRLTRRDDYPINALIAELIQVEAELLPRVAATVAALGTALDAGVRDALFDSLHDVANEMSKVAQSLM